MSQLLADLEAYVRVPAPSGREAELARLVRDHWDTAGSVTADRLGNLSVTIGSGGRHLAIVAHLDEVGVVVRRVTPDGFVLLNRLGGLPERALAARRMLLLGRDGPVPGVIGTHPHHLTPDEAKYRVPPIDQIYVDVGATSAEEVAELGLRVGDYGTYDRTFTTARGRVVANALDDRAGLAALTATLRRVAAGPPPGRVSFVASVQEEFNVRALLPTVRALDPDVLIVVDVSPATDTPEMAGRHSDVRLGSGPVVHLQSFHGRGTLAGVLPPTWLVQAVEDAADPAGVVLQRATFFGGLTDGSYAQLEHRGIATVEVAIPVRYTHTPSETCAMSDVEAMVELLVALSKSDLREVAP